MVTPMTPTPDPVGERSSAPEGQPALRLSDVVRYLPAERLDRYWCREGLAIVQWCGPQIGLVDTYWEHSYNDAHVLTPAEAATAEVLFNLDDYTEISARWEWERYETADRQTVTAQHGLRARYYVRIGAQESMRQQIQNARYKVAEAEEKAESAARAVAWAQRDLDELIARSAVPAPIGTPDE